MNVISGQSPTQLLIYGAVAVVVVLLGLWHFWTPVSLWAGRVASRAQRPTELDSDRRAPVGAHRWMDEVLSAIKDAPDGLKLEIITDPETTVATALVRYNAHLRGEAKP